MTRKITKWYCDHCNNGFVLECDAEEHEPVCVKNPILKNCFSCDNFAFEPEFFGAPDTCGVNSGSFDFVDPEDLRDCPEWKEINKR